MLTLNTQRPIEKVVLRIELAWDEDDSAEASSNPTLMRPKERRKEVT